MLPIRYHSHPVYALPVELLTRIFVLGAAYEHPYDDHDPFLLKPDQHYYPVPSSNFQLLVSHVCHQWRQIALRTSSLWTRLHFREPSHLPRAQAFLERSKGPAFHQVLDILVNTVSKEEHIPGVTLYKEQLHAVFQLIIPHVHRWRAFHLKIRDNECKAIARFYLGNCGPAPSLETLQLYHFEDYRTSQNLYLATYRPPVVVFNNHLPRLTNVSLIGVNLPWEKSPYLVGLHNLQLALHSDNIRPPYEHWDSILRNSPDLKTLSLHYSGPRVANGDQTTVWPTSKERLCIQSLEGLSLTDLDPDYLCSIMERLMMPSVKRLALDLPDQDFTAFVHLISGPLIQVRGQAGQGHFSDQPQDGGSSSPVAAAATTSTSAIHSNSPLSSSCDPTPIVTTGVLPPDSTLTITAPPPHSPLSPTSTLAPPQTYDVITPHPLLHTPLPFLGRLESLTLTALECTIESWRNLVGVLYGLRVIEIDFGRVDHRFVGVLMEGSNSSSSSSSSSVGGTPPHLSDDDGSQLERTCATPSPPPYLPNLHTFKVSNLAGPILEQYITYREQECDQEYRVKKWVVKWCERWKGRDLKVDELVEWGWVSSAENAPVDMGLGGKEVGLVRQLRVDWEPPGPEEDEEEEEEEEEGGDEDVDVDVVSQTTTDAAATPLNHHPSAQNHSNDTRSPHHHVSPEHYSSEGHEPEESDLEFDNECDS